MNEIALNNQDRTTHEVNEMSNVATLYATRTFGEFTIEKGVPIPPAPGRLGKKPKYPFGIMEIGDSVFLAGIKIGVAGSRVNNERKKGKKFTARTEEGGVRVWRIG